MTAAPPSKVLSTRCECCQGRGIRRERRGGPLVTCMNCKGRGYFLIDLSGHTAPIIKAPPRDRTAIRARVAALIRERKADARCVSCGTPADKTRCDSCADKHAERMRLRRA